MNIHQTWTLPSTEQHGHFTIFHAANLLIHNALIAACAIAAWYLGRALTVFWEIPPTEAFITQVVLIELSIPVGWFVHQSLLFVFGYLLIFVLYMVKLTASKRAGSISDGQKVDHRLRLQSVVAPCVTIASPHWRGKHSRCSWLTCRLGAVIDIDSHNSINQRLAGRCREVHPGGRILRIALK